MPRVRTRDVTLGASIVEASGAAPAPCKNCGLNEKWKAMRPVLQVFDLDMQTTQRPMLEGRDAERAAAFGAVFELSGLNEVSVANPAEFMTRATNMAGVCILGLQVLDADKRKQALTDFGGAAWAQSVLDLASNVGLQKLEDNIRFSLALHFLIGIIHFESNIVSSYQEAYGSVKYAYDHTVPAPLTKEQAAPYIARAFPEDKARAWAAKVGYVASPATDELNGLGQLNAELHPYEFVESEGSGGLGSLDGLDGLDSLGWFPWDQVKAFGGAVLSAGKAIVGAVVDTLKWVGGKLVDALGALFNFTGDIVCAGLKWLLGDTVGGIICSIFSTFATILKYTLTSLFEVAKAIAMGLVGFVKALIEGNPKKAGMVLLTEVTAVIFLLPPLGPMLAVLMGVSVEEIGDMGRRVAQRAPLFLIGVISAIFNMLALTPASVVKFIEALRPAVEVFAGAAVFATAGGTATLEACENAVGSIMSHCTAIILRVIDFAATASKIASAADSADAAAIEAMVGKIIKAMMKLNFKDIVATIVSFGVTPGLAGKRLAAAPGGTSPGSLKEQMAKAAIKDQLDILNEQLKQMDPHVLAPIMYAGTSRMSAADSETLFFATLKNLPPDQQLIFLSRLADRGVTLPEGTGFPDAPGLPTAAILNFGLWPIVLGGAGLLTIGGLLLRRRS